MKLNYYPIKREGPAAVYAVRKVSDGGDQTCFGGIFRVRESRLPLLILY